ncbi:MAG: pyruvate synthase subunit beta [Deltaproteobacteria bacterium]|nr:pyruvate synthase subunit beta [Deltaproteobacteria bacterium]MBW1951528.1 pyruvate synthase subunit beta [Deltaproteobacteria bacterium]MBW1987700.1 pyruvate synthase subunit beta [Deltaproteobacteria bacterium]MBW2135194.1 pyruvate synthase subunit beta [Deltaproteobacteria bacterium]
METALDTFEKFDPQHLPEFEPLAPGHRACQGCGEVLALRLAAKALGREMIVVSATGCMEIISSAYPQTAWRVPWLHVAFENAAAVASGVEAALRIMKGKGKITRDDIPILAVAGDGGTADIGLQALSGAWERGHNFIYLCLDNEAYMNTGIQRSSLTPYGAATTTSPPGKLSIGEGHFKKDLPAIAVAHKIPYVATVNPAYYLDLMNKVKKAALIQGPAYLHAFSPCPTGWRHEGRYAVKIARLAVQTRVFPLYEVINGKYFLNRKVTKPKPVREYLKLQRRFAHLTEEDIEIIQENVNNEYDRLLRLSEEVDLETKLTTSFQQYLDQLKQQMDEAYKKLREEFQHT